MPISTHQSESDLLATRYPLPATGLQPFLRELLDEQQRLQTPVAQFARQHAERPSALQPFSPSLLPLSAPGPGEQYAFQVDLDSCSGCKACVSACHSLNGLDENETWRDVGMLLAATDAAKIPNPKLQIPNQIRLSEPAFSQTGRFQPFSPPRRASPSAHLGGQALQRFSQTVTTACHHCADPGCLNGCPVLAYEKDPVTGIVRHLDDQCIGCSYCILKCPYDVPKYNDRLGIVRKCDLCHGRLAAGEAPACAQACPTHAITIVTVPVGPGPAADTSTFLPGAPDPAWTQPTTRYVSRQPLPTGVRAADADALHLQPPHWPLVVMLTGTQASVGALAAGANQFALAAALFGLAASVLHLGQPLRAWRAFLGLRRSWLSREIVVFGAYPPLLMATFAPDLAALAQPAALITGVLGIACSIMIYADTPRAQWALPRTALRFGGTTVIIGLAAAWMIGGGASPSLASALMAVTLGKLVLERPSPGDSRQRRLHTGPLRRTMMTRRFLGVLGGVVLPGAALLDPASAAGCAILSLAALLIAEGCERVLFFRSVDPSKMPGQAMA